MSATQDKPQGRIRLNILVLKQLSCSVWEILCRQQVLTLPLLKERLLPRTDIPIRICRGGRKSRGDQWSRRLHDTLNILEGAGVVNLKSDGSIVQRGIPPRIRRLKVLRSALILHLESLKEVIQHKKAKLHKYETATNWVKQEETGF